LLLGGRWRWRGRRLFTWEPRASLIAHGNEECGDVFAVLIGLLKGRASTRRRYPFASEANRDFVGVGIGSLDLANGFRCIDVDVFYDLALFVVEATKKRSGTKEAA
jgi:hypothetical protein